MIKVRIKMRVNDEGKIAFNVQSAKGANLNNLDPTNIQNRSFLTFLKLLSTATVEFNKGLDEHVTPPSESSSV